MRVRLPSTPPGRLRGVRIIGGRAVAATGVVQPSELPTV
jgi:hypothetical protein